MQELVPDREGNMRFEKRGILSQAAFALACDNLDKIEQHGKRHA